MTGKSWTFPRGKVNENESELACACREVYEETGRDIVWIFFINKNIQHVYIYICMCIYDSSFSLSIVFIFI